MDFWPSFSLSHSNSPIMLFGFWWGWDLLLRHSGRSRNGRGDMLRPIRWLYNTLRFSWLPPWTGPDEQSQREWKQDWSQLEAEHKENTEELNVLAAELGASTPPPKPQPRRQRVYKNGHHCGDCGTPTPGPKCARCVQKESSNVQHRTQAS